MNSIKISISNQVWDDHTDRLYNAQMIACSTPHYFLDKCDDCRNGKRYQMPMIHVDGESHGLIHSIERNKTITKVLLSREAIEELLSDCDYFSDALECKVLDGDIQKLARKMRGAAISIRKQLAKAGA
jgi:hypothetical protein